MLNPWFITGFTDGEGCFSIYVRADKQKRKNTIAIYYRWQVDFAIGLRGDDINALEHIKEYFDCGSISLVKKTDTKNIHDYGQCGYYVLVPNDLVNKVIPHFETYPLQSKKQNDFLIWKEAVLVIKTAKDRKKSSFDKVVYTSEENEKLVEVKGRVTGRHLTQKRISYDLQGEKEIIEIIEEKVEML